MLITEKTCTKCKITKPITEFNKNAKNKDGYRCECRLCQRASYDSNKQKEYDEQRNKTQKRKEYQQQRLNTYYQTPEYKKYKQEYDKKYNETHKEERRLAKRKHYIENKEKYLNWNKEYRQRNKNELIEKYRYRYRNDITFRLNTVMSSNLHKALKGKIKSEIHWENAIGYTIQELKEHLESQFTPEMNWNNYGTYWEIDHIIPQNLFSFSSCEDEQFKICWSLENLRPLTCIDNRKRPKDGSDINIGNSHVIEESVEDEQFVENY